MNMSDAHKMSASATDAVDGALSGLQLMLSRKKKERDERAAGYKTIIGIMESELEGVDADIAQLEHFISGQTAEPETTEAAAGEQHTDHKLPGSTLMLNGHDREAAE